MNKLGVFTITLLCLLLEFASSIQFRDSLNARLAVRKNLLKTIDPEAGNENDVMKIVPSPPSPASLMAPTVPENEVTLPEKIEGAVKKLYGAEEALRQLLKEAKKNAVDESLKRVENVTQNKVGSERENVVAENILLNPNTEHELDQFLASKVKNELEKEDQAKRIVKQLNQELLDHVRNLQEKQENETVAAMQHVAKGIVSTLASARRETQQLSNDVNRQLSSVVASSFSKLDQFINSTLPSPSQQSQQPLQRQALLQIPSIQNSTASSLSVSAPATTTPASSSPSQPSKPQSQFLKQYQHLSPSEVMEAIERIIAYVESSVRAAQAAERILKQNNL